MKWRIVIIAIAALVLIGVSLWNANYSETIEEAVRRDINQEAPVEFKNQDYQIVNVPDSDYSLAIFTEPNTIWVYTVKKRFSRYSATISTGMNLYENVEKGSDSIINDKLVYGTKVVHDGQQVSASGRKVSLFSLEEYYAKTKFAWSYKDLYFYYLDKPLKVVNNETYTGPLVTVK